MEQQLVANAYYFERSESILCWLLWFRPHEDKNIREFIGFYAVLLKMIQYYLFLSACIFKLYQFDKILPSYKLGVLNF